MKGSWMGEVRSISDTTGSGKVQVRIFTQEDNLGTNPDENLRWAEVAYPTTTGQVPGSSTMHGLMPGSKVLGTFYSDNEYNDRENRDNQKPIILYVLSKPAEGKAS